MYNQFQFLYFRNFFFTLTLLWGIDCRMFQEYITFDLFRSKAKIKNWEKVKL